MNLLAMNAECLITELRSTPVAAISRPAVEAVCAVRRCLPLQDRMHGLFSISSIPPSYS
jgi:hypothetical protein